MSVVDCRVHGVLEHGLWWIVEYGGQVLGLYWTVEYTGTESVVDCRVYGRLILGLY